LHRSRYGKAVTPNAWLTVSAVLCATPQIFKKIKEMQEEGDASLGDL